MFNKTTSAKKTKYYQIFNELTDDTISTLHQRKKTIKHQTTNRFYQYNKPVYIKCTKGIAVIALAKEENQDNPEYFVIHRVVKVNKGVLIGIISLTNTSTIEIFSEPFTKHYVIHLDEELNMNRIIPTFDIKEIYSYYYQVKGPGYFFSGEKHKYWELTYVDTGELKSTIGDYTFTIKEKEIMLYGPDQFHNQYVDSDRVCSYMTIMFDMNPKDYDHIINRTFHLHRQIYPIMQNIMKVTTHEGPLSDQLLLVYVKELVLQLYRYDSIEPQSLSMPAQQSFEDELLNEIVVYIKENLNSPLTVENITQQYSVSRSTLQSLFKKNLDIAPKQYINEAKLAKSKLLIKENKYTLSEVSDMLSYTSIHYFSRTFKKRFGITPSEYAKSIYK